VSRNGANGRFVCAWGASDWKYGTSEHSLGKSGTARAARADLGVQLRVDQDRVARIYPVQLAFGRVLLAAAVLLLISWLRGLRMLNATTPLWTVTVALLARTERTLPALRAAGLLLGFAGAIVISRRGDPRAG
jgi:hypothetical protein